MRYTNCIFSLGISVTISVACSLMLLGYSSSSIAAQNNHEGRLPRSIIEEIQQEIAETLGEAAKGSPVPDDLLTSLVLGKEKADTSGLERYAVIVEKNLFKPLGSGQVVDKRQEFAVTGILGKSAIIMQLKDGSGSFYVSEGESFGNGARLVRIEENRVTIVHEGKQMQLRLGEGVPIRERNVERVGKQGLLEHEEGGDGREEEMYEQEIEEVYRYVEEAEQIISELGSLMR